MAAEKCCEVYFSGSCISRLIDCLQCGFTGFPQALPLYNGTLRVFTFKVDIGCFSDCRLTFFIYGENVFSNW